MLTGPSLQRKGPGRGTPRLQAPSRRPLLLSKLTLAPATYSYLLHNVYVRTAELKNCDIIGEIGDPCSDMIDKRNSDQRRICLFISKPTKQGLQGKELEKGRQGATLPDRPLNREGLRVLSVHLHHCRVLWYRMLIHLRNSDLNPVVS